MLKLEKLGEAGGAGRLSRREGERQVGLPLHRRQAQPAPQGGSRWEVQWQR